MNKYITCTIHISYIYIYVYSFSSIEPLFRKRVPGNTDALVRAALVGRRMLAVAQFN